MGNGRDNTAGIELALAKGWKPSVYLTDMSMAYFQKDEDYVAKNIFPICPVQQSTGLYYIFNKGDLARDQVGKKPAFGKVDVAVMSNTEDTYKCVVDQVIVGIDQIAALDYSRARTPGVNDPKRAKVRFATEQMKLHQDILFAQKYFQTGVWANELTGVASAPSAGQFLKWTDANFDPIGFFDDRIREIKLRGRRKPNRLALGYEAYLTLKNHKSIVERVKYSGSTANPGKVNLQVLAELLDVERVVVLESTYNSASLGNADNMQFVCDSKSALLCYATDTPQVDEPSAGYMFTWDMLGNGQTLAMDQWEGEKGTHTEFVEGLIAYDMKKTSDDLATFMKSVI